MNLKTIFLSLLPILCLTLSSCIDGQDEITIREDGSGRAQISYNIPLRAMSKEESQQLESYLRKVAQQHDCLTLTHFSSTPSGFGMQRLDVRAEFTSIQEVATIYEEEICGTNAKSPDLETQALLDKACALMGKFDVSLKGLNISVDREINLHPLFEGKIKDPKVLGESEFRYILHLPRAVSTTNATKVSDDRKTLQWTVKLKNHFDNPIVMQSSVPLPWWIPTILTLLLLLTASGFIWLSLRIRRKKRQARESALS